MFSIVELFFIFSCKSLPEGKSFYEPYLERKKVEYKIIPSAYGEELSLNQIPKMISQKDAFEDIDTFFYILENCYAGFSKAKQNGLKEDVLKETMKTWVLEKKSFSEGVKPGELLVKLYEETSPYINDMHFQMHLAFVNRIYSRHKDIYFSNTYVKGDGGRYRVFLTDSDEVGIGEVFSGREENLFYYPSRGLDVYRIGAMSEEELSSINIRFESGEKNLKLLNPAFFSIPEKLTYKESETKDSAYIYISTFCMPEISDENRKEAEKIFSSYADAAFRFKDKKNLILDLRGNEGGNMNVSLSLLVNLYLGKKSSLPQDDIVNAFIEKYYSGCFTVESPGTVENTLEYLRLYFPDMKEELSFIENRRKALLKNPERNVFHMNEYASVSDKPSFSIPENCAFKGRLFILTDRNSFSASEDIVTFARLLFKDSAEVFVLGENTAGCIEYGGLLFYRLPNSKITVLAAQSSFSPFESKVSSWKGEGAGHFPDAWSTREDINDTLRLLLQ